MKLPKINKERWRTRLKNLFTTNISLKVVSLIFAMMLWGYVLTDVDPYRTKYVQDVTLSFDGEAELMAKGLCVRGDREGLLSAVDVAVRTRVKNYTDVTANSVTATINLKNISQANVYQLPIQASITSALGVVETVSPGTISVEIDSLVYKTVPVSCVVTGQLPDGFWADMEAISSTARLDIQGPKTDVSRISRAECVIDLTDRTTTIFGTFDVILYDSENEIIDSSIVVGTLPSSTVRLPIYPVKSVPLDVEGAMIGANMVPANYELASATATPQSLRIVGEQSLIEQIETLSLEPFSISGMRESGIVETDVILPEGIRLIDEPTVSIALDIREKTDLREYVQIPVEITGLSQGLEAEVSPVYVDVTIEGRMSLVSLLKRSDVSVDVDVTGLAAGTYDLPLSMFVKNDEATVELTITPSVSVVTVTIR